MEPTLKGDRLALALSPAWVAAFPGAPIPRLWCARMVRLATGIDRLNVQRCNREVSPAEERRDDRRREQVKALVAELGEGWDVRIGTEPRGHAVRIKRPGDRPGGAFITEWLAVEV